MAVAFDAATQSDEWTGTTPDTQTHTPVGTPRAVAIIPLGAGSVVDDAITGASYGALALTLVPSTFISDTGTEQGVAGPIFFAGSSIPTGAQSCTVTQSGGNGETRRFYVITWTAAADCEVVDSDRLGEDQTNPALTLDSGSRTAARALAVYSGRPTANIAPTAGLTNDFETAVAADVKSFSFGHETTPSSGATALGWTAAVDDCALVGLAVAEVQAATAAKRVIGGGFF